MLDLTSLRDDPAYTKVFKFLYNTLVTMMPRTNQHYTFHYAFWDILTE